MTTSLATKPQIEELLKDLHCWLQFQVTAHIAHRSTGNGGHDGNGNSWTVVEIPEWSVRQKLSAISEALAELTKVTA